MSKTKEKQILYPSLFKRVISSTMDMLVVSTIFTPLTSWINRQIFMDKYGKLLLENDVDVRDSEALKHLFYQPEIASKLSFADFMEVTLPMFIVHIASLAIYFIGSWYYINSTPMKYMLGMKIVDAETGGKPKLSNLIWRFIGYSLFLIGLWFIVFTKKKQALHDKIGKTAIVKV